MAWQRISRRNDVESGQKAFTTAGGRLNTAVADAQAPDGGSGESGRCAWIARRGVSKKSDRSVKAADKSDLIRGALHQEPKLRLTRIGTDLHRATGGAAAHAGMVLRFLVIAPGLNVAAWSAMSQCQGAIERKRIGIGTGGEAREHSLDHEHIGREDRDPAARR